MKMPLIRQPRRLRESGTAVISVIALLALLLVFVMGNARTLDHLGKELRLLENRQRARIQMPQMNPAGVAPGGTNAPTAAPQFK